MALLVRNAGILPAPESKAADSAAPRSRQDAGATSLCHGHLGRAPARGYPAVQSLRRGGEPPRKKSPPFLELPRHYIYLRDYISICILTVKYLDNWLSIWHKSPSRTPAPDDNTE